VQQPSPQLHHTDIYTYIDTVKTKLNIQCASVGLAHVHPMTLIINSSNILIISAIKFDNKVILGTLNFS